MISVVVPVYNVEEYLRQCLDSILTQTYRDLELILVDDGSTDASGEICEEYAAKDSRVKVVRRRNGGMAAARNTGLDLVSGEYVAFVDSDDYICETMFETLRRAIVENDADLAQCNFERVKDDGKPAPSRLQAPPLFDGVLSSENALEKLAGQNSFAYNCVWNKLYKAELFKELRFPIVEICEDNFFTYKLFFACSKVAFVSEKLYRYRQNPKSITSVTNHYFTQLYALEGKLEQLRFFEKHGLQEALRIGTYSLFDLFSAMLVNYRPDESATRKRVVALKREIRKFVFKFRNDYRFGELLYFEAPRLFSLLKNTKDRFQRIIEGGDRRNNC